LSDNQGLSGQQIAEFAAGILIQVGMSEGDAAIVGDALAWADLRGIAAQGLAKLPIIVARLRAGGTSPNPKVTVVQESPVVTVFDAADEWGHVSGVRAMRAAVAKAKRVGAGISLVRNTSTASAMGYYANVAAEQGLIGLALNNGAPLLRTWGGTTELLGNQAFAIGAPSRRHAPLLLDTALSAITLTAIQELLARGMALPAGLALNAAGDPTTDPEEALGGSLLPSGGHRGYGLAIMFEALTGLLSGSARFAEDVTPLEDVRRPQSVSHFMLAIDPGVSMPLDQFRARVDDLIDRIHASVPAAGVDQVRVPGERSATYAAAREANGVLFPADRLAELRDLGAEFDVYWR